MKESELTKWRWENNPHCEFLQRCKGQITELVFTHQCLDPIGKFGCKHYHRLKETLTPFEWSKKLGLTVGEEQ